ncbi:hypothetical protein EVAR_55801_1 [Eumeta japonica]|uniref:Uncharacterized protein n=1 Tax=Eumeta variegata TaxID=151549 RepID=A0A4C1YSS3_EUMVA|nr:hypothetical protein EVAR_55801_1 [Eumeta japonica]
MFAAAAASAVRSGRARAAGRERARGACHRWAGRGGTAAAGAEPPPPASAHINKATKAYNILSGCVPAIVATNFGESYLVSGDQEKRAPAAYQRSARGLQLRPFVRPREQCLIDEPRRAFCLLPAISDIEIKRKFILIASI